jgi:L-lactate dehydrogenase complex protein LldG
MASAREEILQRLHSQRRQWRQPGAWQSRREFPDLVERFAAALEAARGEVFVAADLAGAVARLERLLLALGALRVACNDEPPLDSLDLPARFPALAWHIVGQSPGSLRGFCGEADVGVSSANAGLAETGTVVVTSGPGRSRLVTLLPPVHIVLLPAARLTVDLFTWTDERAGAWPANVTLISGPSKTADIEQTLAVGVHGPRRLMVIVYG